MAAAIRSRQPLLIYQAQSLRKLLDRVAACCGAPLTIDARDPNPDLLDAFDPKARAIVVLLPHEMPELVADAIRELGGEVPLVAITNAHRISDAHERAFTFRLREEQVL